MESPWWKKTEIDVACSTHPYNDCDDWDDAKEVKQAQLHRDTLRVCLEEPACTSYTIWGFSDKCTWITELANDREQCPLPFDEIVGSNGTHALKQAFYAMMDELESH
jgi:endo-1,4-beta-xylanase